MKIKWGALVTNGSGKIGGHVAAKNKGGSYLRTKVTPTNPQTSYQIGVRSNFATNSRGWLALTDAQRLAWNNATTLQQRSNVFGDTVKLSGKALYQSVNNNLLNITEGVLSLPVNPESSFAFTTVAATIDNSSQSVSLAFTAAIPATHKIIVNATPALSAGISNAVTKLRQVTVLASTDTTPKVISSAYIARLGAVGAAGYKVHFTFIAVEIASGVANYAGSCVATIVA